MSTADIESKPSTETTDHERVHEKVSSAYARAVTSETGCCGPQSPKGVAAKTAGYTTDDLEGLPEEAVTNSFGCGNPLAFSEVRPGDVVLDLGSGAGLDLLIAARKVGPEGRAIGVDMTDEMIAKARQTIADANLPNAEVRKGLIEELPVEDASVDWVISNCVINLSPDKQRVFSEISRVLKPGGRVRVSDIVAEDLPSWARANQSLYNSCLGGAISEADYAAGLEAAGLEAVEVTERLVYDAAQLVELVQSDLADLAESETGGCCGSPPLSALGAEQLTPLADQVSGKIWSAKFSARKR